MSRIYEALKRAESERTVAQSGPELRSTQSGAPMIAPASFAEPEPAMLSVMDKVIDTEVESNATPLSANLLNLSEVRRRPWTPSVVGIPALLGRGPAVEQFRSLRSRIFEFRGQNPLLKSLLISSGLPGEGKSFVAANLAFSLARHKKSSVLLIDGDLRCCSLQKLLGCEAGPGLAEYLAGKASVLEIMQRAEQTNDEEVSRRQALANLTFIPAGHGGDQAADLTGSRRFAELIETVAPSFDWIVVDSSPVIPVSDAVNLARACDGVLLVARSGVTRFTEAQRAQSELRASKILGFVLNAVKDAPVEGGYYGYQSQ
ncbi:MAG: CpsD/CapB family tyrosine-protein kinase [Acidobacteriaceae bacterium]